MTTATSLRRARSTNRSSEHDAGRASRVKLQHYTSRIADRNRVSKINSLSQKAVSAAALREDCSLSGSRAIVYGCGSLHISRQDVNVRNARGDKELMIDV